MSWDSFTSKDGGGVPRTFVSDAQGVDNGKNAVVKVAAPTSNTSAGCTPFTLTSGGNTNATSVKATPGNLYHIVAFNTNASPRYLKLYNKASAPTVGTDTPVLKYTIPGNAAGAGFIIPLPYPAAFSTGIAFALTTGAANSDTGAVGANEVIIDLLYL